MLPGRSPESNLALTDRVVAHFRSFGIEPTLTHVSGSHRGLLSGRDVPVSGAKPVGSAMIERAGFPDASASVAQEQFAGLP